VDADLDYQPRKKGDIYDTAVIEKNALTHEHLKYYEETPTVTYMMRL
jgi:hypothetical protein